MKKKEIAEIFGVDPHTVARAINRHEETGEHDYAIWSILEAQVNAEAHNSVESLRQAINETFENLNQDMINRANDDWPRRLDTVIASKEGHFE
uniref:Transposase n=1 Tax=Acrobeloides nanus TaxID=290746 RepID=A0A914DJW6_9BILA